MFEFYAKGGLLPAKVIIAQVNAGEFRKAMRNSSRKQGSLK